MSIVYHTREAKSIELLVSGRDAEQNKNQDKMKNRAIKARITISFSEESMIR